MIRHWPRTSARTLTILMVSLAVGRWLAGCEKPNFGPKSPDYQLAHNAHYHPDVKRQQAATQPESTTQPVDFKFGGGPLGTPILFVNGECITVPEVLEPMYEDLAKRAKGLTEESYRDYLLRRAAEQIGIEISRVMIYQEAKRNIPDKADEAFAKETEKIINDIVNNRFGGVRARYETYLKTIGFSMPEMKERTKRQLMVSQYLRERFKPLIQNPSRGQLMAYFQAHKADFTSPARAEMFLIEIPLESELGREIAQATSEQMATARQRSVAKVRRAREELESGVSFADVARQYSKGLQAARGGAIGEISAGSMTARYTRPAEVLFRLKEDQVSGPIETEEAVFLVQCGKKTPAHPASFEECQVQIMNKLMDEQADELQRKYIADLEKKSTIRRKSEFMLAVLSAAPRPPQYETASAREPAGG